MVFRLLWACCGLSRRGQQGLAESGKGLRLASMSGEVEGGEGWWTHQLLLDGLQAAVDLLWFK